MRVPPFALFILCSREALYLNFIFLSSDSSPQGGLDYLLTIEDTIARSKAALCIDVSDSELATFSALGHLKLCVLPVSVIGSGNAALSAKFEALFNSVCLDNGNKSFGATLLPVRGRILQ